MDINSENRDEIIFSYVEGLLDGEQKAAFEASLAMDESLRADVAIFKKTAFIVPEPLDGYEDISDELVKSTSSTKWIWFGFIGLFVFVSGVFAIYYLSQTSEGSLVTTRSVVKDSILIKKDTGTTSFGIHDEIVKKNTGLEKNLEKIGSIGNEKSPNISLPSQTEQTTVIGEVFEEKGTEASKVEENNMNVVDTIRPVVELKEKSGPSIDSSSVKKVKPEVKKVAKSKPSKKLNIKGTEEIKTNSSLY